MEIRACTRSMESDRAGCCGLVINISSIEYVGYVPTRSCLRKFEEIFHNSSKSFVKSSEERLHTTQPSDRDESGPSSAKNVLGDFLVLSTVVLNLGRRRKLATRMRHIYLWLMF